MGSGIQYNSWDPLKKASNVTLSNQNRTAAMSAGAGTPTVLSVHGRSSGIYQVEHTVDAYSSAGALWLGVAYSTVTLSGDTFLVENLWALGGSYNKTNNIGQGPFINGSGSWAITAVIGAVIDIDSNTLDFYVNGTAHTYDPPGDPPPDTRLPGSNIMFVGSEYANWSTTVYWAFRVATAGTGQVTTNFGHAPFSYPVGGAIPMYGPTT